MKQSVVCDTQNAVFVPTEAMVERHRLGVEEYLEEIVSAWALEGQIPGNRTIEFMRRQMHVPERKDWMHPLDAIAQLIAADLMRDAPSAEQALNNRDAMRTRLAHDDMEWSKHVAAMMGLRSEYARSIYGGSEGGRGGSKYRRSEAELESIPTAVYRHYDASGLLLYIGITCDQSVRESMHGTSSPWWKHVRHSEMTWYETRSKATEAEKSLIIELEPMFNTVYNTYDPMGRDKAKYLRDHHATRF